MTTIAILVAASGLPGDVAAAWPLHLGWLAAPALLAFAGLGVSALLGRGAPSPVGASTSRSREPHLREAA